MSERVIIVGASHAGIAAADALRRAGFAGEIMLISRESHPPYQRPLLSKASDLLDLAPERLAIRQASFFSDGGIALLLASEVVRIDPDARRVVLQDGRSLRYDHLILATGARVRELPESLVSGAPPLSMRRLEEAMELRRRWVSASAMTVIGGGLIGLELAALARATGLAVTIIEASDRLLGRVVPLSVSRFIERFHADNGIEIRLGARLERLDGSERGYAVTLADGEIIASDIVLSAIGAEPEITLARDAGLVHENGIVVSPTGATSADRIWALGDCAFWTFSPEGRQGARFEGIQPATEQARIIAQALTGKQAGRLPVPRFWSHQGDIKLQMAGQLSGDHEIIRHGDIADGSFCELATENGRAVACYAVNAPNAFRSAVRLVEQGAPVSADQDIETLLAS